MRAVKVYGQLAGLGRQPVLEGDGGRLARGAPDRRPRKGAAVRPHLRLAAGEELDVRLLDGKADVGAGQLLWDREPAPERLRLRGGKRRREAWAGSAGAKPRRQCQRGRARRDSGQEPATAETPLITGRGH